MVHFSYSGAELFAKRRKRSEKWIVDDTSRGSSVPVTTSYTAGPTPLYDSSNQNALLNVNMVGENRNHREVPRFIIQYTPHSPSYKKSTLGYSNVESMTV